MLWLALKHSGVQQAHLLCPPALAHDVRPAHSSYHARHATTRDKRRPRLLPWTTYSQVKVAHKSKSFSGGASCNQGPTTTLTDHAAGELLFTPVVEEHLVHHIPPRTNIAPDVQHFWRCIRDLRWRNVLKAWPGNSFCTHSVLPQGFQELVARKQCFQLRHLVEQRERFSPASGSSSCSLQSASAQWPWIHRPQLLKSYQGLSQAFFSIFSGLSFVICFWRAWDHLCRSRKHKLFCKAAAYCCV